MRIVVTNHVDAWAANLLLEKWNSIRSLGLATGATPETLYGWLVQFYYEGKISFRDKITVNMDEYYQLPPNHPQSYRATMQRQLIQYVDIRPENFHVPTGLTTDIERACAEYERMIQRIGGVDLWILGIGMDGHIAFNEPGSERDTRTRLVILTATTVKSNARYFENDIAQVPRQAVSVGVATILDAREILLLAKGKNKAHAVANAILGDETSKVPASFLQSHPNCTFLLDAPAASELWEALPPGTTTIRSASGVRHTIVRES